MKSSKIAMTAAFVLAIGASFAFKPSASKKPLVTHYKVVSGVCTSFDDQTCTGPNTRPICSAVFQTIDPDTQQCTGTTWMKP